MRHFGKENSLIPYLNAQGGNSYLKLSLISRDAATRENMTLPFVELTETDPLARMFEAQFVTDGGSELRKVFLLVQRDQNLLKRDALWPISNRDVESVWQKAFSFYAGAQKDPSPIVLSSQVNPNGELIPFSPLFYCKKQEIFFHPPCPRCGVPLALCENDDLLIDSGLQPYSRTLVRYLFCASCTQSGKGDYYVYEVDPSDPPSIKDRETLIKDFRLLCETGDGAGEFPCRACANTAECFGQNNLALSRIVPFSFYPFHMLIFHAMSLNALDFLALAGGAPLPELEAHLEARGQAGRMRCLKSVFPDGFEKIPVFFERDERYFLEVLYLKLTFLEGVLRDICSDDTLSVHPDLSFSIDRIWVRLLEQGGLLPYFWNFRVGLIDVGIHMHETGSFPRSPASNSLFYLGLLWFYTLLVNRQQDIIKVYRSLREMIDQNLARNESAFAEFLKNNHSPTFQPSNIFWDPEAKVVRDDWLSHWKMSLQLGLSLLGTAFRYEPGWFFPFLEQLQNVRRDVRNTMFTDERLDIRQATAGEDAAIYRILTKISRKWQRGIDTPSEIDDEAVSSSQTVLLSAQSDEKEEISSEEPLLETADFTAQAEDEEEVSTAKTVLLRVPRDEKEEVPPEEPLLDTVDLRQTSAKNDEAVGSSKTVLLKVPGEEKEDASSDEPLPETVILTPSEDKGSVPSPSHGTQGKETRDPAKTESFREGELQEDEQRRAEKRDEEDFLTETVILKPGKGKDKGRDG